MRFWDEVNLEDVEIVEVVQRGLANTSYTGGRMCYRFEESVHRFQNLEIDRMLGIERIPDGDADEQVPMFARGALNHLSEVARDRRLEAALVHELVADIHGRVRKRRRARARAQFRDGDPGATSDRSFQRSRANIGACSTASPSGIRSMPSIRSITRFWKRWIDSSNR